MAAAFIRLATCGVLALLAIGGGATAASGFLNPSAPNPLAGLGVGAEERAVRAAGAGQAEADVLSRRFLEAAPASVRAWNLKAFLAGRDGLTPQTVDALRRSYTVAPLGPVDSNWRLTYLYERWDALPVDLRRLARAEHRALVRAYGPNVVRVGDIANPAGRLAAGVNDRPLLNAERAARP